MLLLDKIMASDERIEQVKATLDQINADDVAEDSAYEQRIAELTSERDALLVEKSAWQTERAGIIADVHSAISTIQATLTFLSARLQAQGA